MKTKTCCKCKQEKDIIEFYKNKSTKDGLAYECKRCKKYWAENKLYHKEWKLKHEKELSTYRTRYKTKNKEKIKQSYKKYNKKPDVKLRTKLRSRIRSAIKNSKKSNSTMRLVGCDLNTLKIYLQKTAIENGYINFNINRYNGNMYHIDHKVPCAKFNLTCSYHQKLCFNYKNLQILTAKVNIIKRDK